MEQIERSETSAYINQTPGIHPKENKQHSEHGESLKLKKYLGIYLDRRLTLDNHIKYTAENSTKLIYMLGKSAKLQLDLGHKSLKTIYEGALIPLLTHGARLGRGCIKKKKETYASCRKDTD